MTIEKNINCPNCNNQIEIAYCNHCKENIFIKPIKTTIVNVKETQCDIFIGRRNTQFHWGNPFTHLDVPTRAKLKMNTLKESIQAFEDWLLGKKYLDIEQTRRKWILENMKSVMTGKILGCFCKPKPCHGDVYVKLLSEGNIERFL